MQPLAPLCQDGASVGGAGVLVCMSALFALFHVCSATALALQHHDPALFWKHVDSRLSVVGDSEDTKRLRRFASTAFDVLRGGSCSATLAAGQECDVPFPGLTAQPWWDTEAFEWAEAVEAGATVIAAELDHFASASTQDGQWLESVTSLCSDTSGFAKLTLREDGEATAVGRRYFSQTLDLLRRANVPLSPRPVAINRQGPRTGLSAHSDNINCILVCHVGVRVPPGCRFTMLSDGTTETRSSREWAPGELRIADTSFVHRTTNDHATDSRYILHFSVWHPDLTPIEVRGISAVHDALRAYEADVS